MKNNNSHLAINGGTPVSKETIVIHKPYLDQKDFDAVDQAIKSTFLSGGIFFKSLQNVL